MTLGSILLATALLLLVGVIVMRPLLATEQRRVLRMTERERLSAEKSALLTQIRALDFDYETGTLPEDTYQRERLILMQDAANTLRLLDGLPELESVDARIEAAVAALRGRSEPASVNGTALAENSERQTSAVVEDDGAIAEIKAAFCPQCGEKVMNKDKFCRSCGEKLYVEA